MENTTPNTFIDFTDKQMITKEHVNRIIKFNTDRNLLNYDPIKEMNMVQSEIDEHIEADENPDLNEEEKNNERVDAIMDMIVFAIGGAYKLNHNEPYVLFKPDVFNHFEKKELVDLNKIVNEIKYDLCMNYTFNIKDHSLDLKLLSTNLQIFLTYLLGRVVFMGYNPILCLDEVLKHIESRKGEINPETGKFEKYTDEESKSLWYEPKYSECKMLLGE